MNPDTSPGSPKHGWSTWRQGSGPEGCRCRDGGGGGAPGSLDLEQAERHRYDVIVMGTHGRKGIPRWMLGSVTEEVIRQALIPVVTVREQRAEVTEPELVSTGA
ncbi:MAG: universal stress protein [Myxococcales bacterium]|nr:universal stress protein [Myxococcales bacterium]